MPRELPPINPYEPALFGAELSEDIPQLDLHGMRAHLAESELDAFVQRTFMDGEEAIKIIHGRGTGVLKALVEEYLRANDQLIASFRGSTQPHEQGAVIVAILYKK